MTQTKPDLSACSFRIGGMSCTNCRKIIEKKLKSLAGIEDAAVNYTEGTAYVVYDAALITPRTIQGTVETLGYTAALDGEPQQKRFVEIIGTLVIVVSLYVMFRNLGINTITAAFPLAGAGMGYGMLAVIGLITSLHCAAMCGGINLTQTLQAPAAPAGVDGGGSEADIPNAPGLLRQQALLRTLSPAIVYNGARVLSYTLTGVVVGALGQVVSVSGRFQGVVQLVAGIFMMLMGVNMLGIFPALRRFTPRLPNLSGRLAALFGRRAGARQNRRAGRFTVGLLNGLMPCGPLQAMQLYALSTGSPLAGGLAMFLFGMGTVPLMFGIGALSTLLSGVSRRPAFAHKVMKAGAVLVMVMGMTMFSYGMGLSGIDLAFFDRAAPALFSGTTTVDAPFTPVIENGFQIVNSTLSGGRYPAITVQQGIPVKWTINAPQGSINGCNNRMIIREYGIEYRFKPGENLIEFMPEKTGRFSYSCWMGMIRSSITVTAEGEAAAAATPLPAGVVIAADSVAIGTLTGDFQTLKIDLNDEGLEPAVLIVKRGVPVEWTIANESLDQETSRLVFPAFYQTLEMDTGVNVISFTPSDDFDFSTSDNAFYGYVKVVDDLTTVDVEAVKAEAANHKTLIYPDAYFEEAQTSGGGGCCARNAG
jgi:sulfite exporter TauE/SafE/copper chaperone CopZ/plastocyanin domain-containing protein